MSQQTVQYCIWNTHRTKFDSDNEATVSDVICCFHWRSDTKYSVCSIFYAGIQYIIEKIGDCCERRRIENKNKVKPIPIDIEIPSTPRPQGYPPMQEPSPSRIRVDNSVYPSDWAKHLLIKSVWCGRLTSLINESQQVIYIRQMSVGKPEKMKLWADMLDWNCRKKPCSDSFKSKLVFPS